MNPMLINFIFIAIFPLVIYIAIKTQKLSFLLKYRDIYYFFYLFITISVLYIVIEKKIFILIPFSTFILWIIIYEQHIVTTEKIDLQISQMINSLTERIKLLEQNYDEVRYEYEIGYQELVKYSKLFSLVEEINKNVELDKVWDKFCSTIVEYFGADKINYIGIILTKKKDIVDIISFSSQDTNFIKIIKDIWMEKQNFSGIEGVLSEKIHSNLYTYILVIKHQLSEEFLPQLKFFINETKIGFVRSILFKEIEELSRIDGLTGLYLRRYFINRLNNEILLATRYNSLFSLIMIDIDFFKKVNDRYGHIVGDFVLKELAKILLDQVKEQGLCARWGGEEFLVFVPYQTPQQVVNLAEKIRSDVENHVFQHQNNIVRITISCGISFYPKEGVNITTLVERADKKLYEAKQSGRNKVVA
jgi:diguanylate cyclase (GGDEF)-like protein